MSEKHKRTCHLESGKHQRGVCDVDDRIVCAGCTCKPVTEWEVPCATCHHAAKVHGGVGRWCAVKRCKCRTYRQARETDDACAAAEAPMREQVMELKRCLFQMQEAAKEQTARAEKLEGMVAEWFAALNSNPFDTRRVCIATETLTKAAAALAGEKP